jgi:hypothetical protein
MQVNTDQLIELEIQARTLTYATRAIRRLFAEAKLRQQKALNATPVDWERYQAASSETFALAGALGALGVIDLPTAEEAV